MNNPIKNIQNLSKNIFQKGFFHLLSANLLIQLVAFASQLFVAGILSPDDIGRIKIIQTYLSIFSIIAGMGFNASTLKLCSENRTEHEKITLFRYALVFTIISTLSLYLIILALNFFHLFSSDKLIQLLIPLGLFPIISNSIFMVYISYFQATKKIKQMSMLTISNKIISIIGIIIFTFWAGIKGYFVAYNLSFIFMLLVSVRVLHSHFKEKLSGKMLKPNFLIHWKFAKSSIFANLLSELSAYIDIIIVGLFIKDMEQIGYYSFALTMMIALRLFPGTVQQITSPFFSSLSTNKIEFLKAYKFYNKILYIVVICTLVAFVLFVPYLLQWIFAGKYDASIHYFYFLAIGWSLRQLVQLRSGAIFGLGKIHYNAYISLITLIFNIFAVSISLYYFGLIGAAYASIPCGLIFIISSNFYFKKAYREMI